MLRCVFAAASGGGRPAFPKRPCLCVLSMPRYVGCHVFKFDSWVRRIWNMTLVIDLEVFFSFSLFFFSLTWSWQSLHNYTLGKIIKKESLKPDNVRETTCFLNTFLFIFQLVQSWTKWWQGVGNSMHSVSGLGRPTVRPLRAHFWNMHSSFLQSITGRW